MRKCSFFPPLRCEFKAKNKSILSVKAAVEKHSKEGRKLKKTGCKKLLEAAGFE